MAIEMKSRKESVENLKMYMMMEKGYVSSKINRIIKYIDTINELVENDVKPQIILDDIFGLINTYQGAINYMFKQWGKVDINGLDGSMDDCYFYNSSDHLFNTYEKVKNAMRRVKNENELIEKLKHIHDLEVSIHDLKGIYKEYFNQIDML